MSPRNGKAKKLPLHSVKEVSHTMNPIGDRLSQLVIAWIHGIISTNSFYAAIEGVSLIFTQRFYADWTGFIFLSS